MRPHRRSILALPLATLLAAATFASGGPASKVDDAVHVSGRVLERGTARPLEAVQVSARGTRAGAVTNIDGRYALEVPRAALAGGELHVVAVQIGYAVADSVVHVGDAFAGDSVTVDFSLVAQAVSLSEIVVNSAGKAAAPSLNAPADRTAIGRATVQAPAPQATPVARSALRSGAAWPRPRWRGWPAGDREEYAHIEESGFRPAAADPLSTFSVDVDPASYSNVRRFLLREGRLPPVDAVQIEEMVNYFSYRYDQPRGNDPVSVTTEVGAAPWAPDHRLLRIGLASRPIDMSDMPPANLVFLLDVSGSMASPDKLPLVKQSLRLLVRRLRPVDRVAIVVYSGAAGIVLPPTSGADKEDILAAIDPLQAGGSTAGGAGLRLAYDVARRSFRRNGNNRVILATDGDFNVGESSDGAMIRLIESERGTGTYLTVLGFGTGNLQSEKMQQLAQHGNGNYAYIDGLSEARKVLVGEMGATLVTVAKDVKVQVEFNPARVRAYRLLGYENRMLAAEDFNDDAKDAGDLGAGHQVTALYEIVPAGSDSDEGVGGVDPLRYRTAPRESERSKGDELAFVKVRYKQPTGSEGRLLQRAVRDGERPVSGDFRFAAAVAGFGMLLRHSEYRGCITASQVMELAQDGLGADPDRYRQGFLDLVQAYERLAGAQEEDPRWR